MGGHNPELSYELDSRRALAAAVGRYGHTDDLHQFPCHGGGTYPSDCCRSICTSTTVVSKNGDAFRASAKANLVSTVVGIPLGWVAALLCEIVVGGASLTISSIPGLSKIALNGRVEDVLATIVTAPWISGEGEPWTVAFAHAILLVPFFFASVWIERRIVQRSLLWCAVAQDDVKRALRDANLVSYAGLLLFTLATLLYLAMRH